MVKPDKIFKRIYDITPEFIKENSIKGLLVDMDNTLLPWHETKLSEKSLAWLKTMTDAGAKICVITNSGPERTSKVMEGTGYEYIHTALKPFPFSFLRAKRKLKVKRENIYVIGDQMVTDALGSKISGLKCIIVDPISPKEQKGTAVNRFFERLIFGRDVRKTYDK